MSPPGHWGLSAYSTKRYRDARENDKNSPLSGLALSAQLIYISRVDGPSGEESRAKTNSRAEKAPNGVKPAELFLSGAFPEEGSPPPSSTPDI
jgi:hypothetical protein